MIRKSWIVILQAAILSIESIFVEFLTELLGIPSLVISGTSIPLAGAILLLITNFAVKRRVAIFKSWKYLISGSTFLAAAVFTWYDSVGRVGASKEGLLAGPLETVAVLFLAWFFLKEKLTKRQLTGVIIALAGFFVTVYSGRLEWSSILPSSLTFGDLEAILSAITFASGIICMTKLVERYSSLEVTGASLLISGLMLTVILLISSSFSFYVILSVPNWIVLILFSLLPLSAALLYVSGLSRIGASLTSTIASSNILLTVVFQLILREYGIKSNLPVNIPLAIIGGAFGIFGIYLIHIDKNKLM